MSRSPLRARRPDRPSRSPAGLLLVVLAVLATLPACPGQRRALSREALLRGLVELPRTSPDEALTLAELATLRVPTPAEAPAELQEAARRLSSLPPLERARTAIAMKGDVDVAEAAWREAGDEPSALVHRCLVERAYERALQARKACARFLDRAPGDPRAAAVLATLYRGRDDDAGVDDVVLERAGKWVEGCRDARPTHGCADLAHLAHRAESRAAARAKDDARARDAVAASGALTKARVEGPFIGDPLYAFEGAGTGRGLARAPRYLEQERTSWNGVLNPSLRAEGGLYRLVARASGEGEVNVVARSRFSLRLFIDGVLVLERRPELKDEPDVTRARVRLGRGEHLIEALVVSYANAGVELSFLHDDGTPALVPANGSPSKVAGAQRLEPRPLVPEARSSDLLARLDASLLRHHLGALGYGIASGAHVEEARALITQLGFAPQALVAAAEALANAPRMPARLARADAQGLWDRLLSSWPEHPSALASRAALLREERPREALAVYRELQKARPDHPAGHRGVAELALSEGLLDEALFAARALVALEVPPLDVSAAREAFVKSGQRAEAARFDARTAREEDALYASGLARRLLDAGRPEDALVELGRLLEGEPGHVALELRWDLLERQDPERALADVEAHLASFPFDRSAWRRRVQLAAVVQDSERARGLAREGVEALGADPELWLALLELGAEAPWSARLHAGDEAVEAAREAGASAFRGHPVVLVVDHEERHVLPDLSSLSLRHWIVRLGSKEALDDFGELSLSPNERVIRLRVVKPDGSERLPELRDGVEDISLTGLSVGDLVELLTASFEDAPLLPGFAHELVAFAKPAPAIVRSYELNLPTRFLDGGLRLFARNGAPAPDIVRDDEGGLARLRFVATDVASLLEEPHAPDVSEAVPVVGWSLGFEEDEWRVLRGTTLLRDAALDPLLVRVAERVAGRGSPAERWRRLFHFVVTRVEPSSSSSDALAVLASGRGTRTPLLLALARAAHLEATPIALHPPVSAPLDLPSGSAWPLTGVAVQVAGRTSLALVDGGLALLDELPPAARGSAVLDLGLTRRSSPLVVDEKAISERPVRVQLDLDWQGERFEGFLAITVPTAQADAFRRMLRGANDEERTAAFEQALASALPGASVTELTLPNLDAFGRPLGIGVALEVPVSGGSLEPARFDHLFADGAAAPFGLFTPLSSYLRVGARQRPLLLNAASEALQVEVTLPEGAAFTEVPERLDEDIGPVRLMQRAEVTDGTLFWTREIHVDTARVPVERWSRFRTRLSALARRTDARLAFVLARPEAKSAQR